MVSRPRLPPLLRKELAWARRNAATLVLVFLVLPGAFAWGTLAFDTVLPTDAPVAVVPEDDSVSRDELAIARGAVAPFSEPVVYRDGDAAFDALEHERVYAVVTVPSGIADPDGEAVVHLSVSGSVVPYHQASQAVVSVMNVYLSTQLPDEIDVSVERHVLGTERSLSGYLLPTFLFVLVMVLALVYLPHNLASEAVVIDRLRVESSLAATVGWKLAVFSALAVVPAVVFDVASGSLGYGVPTARPAAIAVYVLTFLALGAVATGVTLLSRFAAWGRLGNVALLFLLGGFSGLFYPAGFFSPVRRELVRLLPTHYAIVAVRGFVLRDAPLAAYDEWLLGLAAVAVAALAFLRGSIAVYEWGA